ncbi:MAG: isoprenyl transferase [Gemmatimonadota bacterium]|nr:isoprenyl transferase [Gemmatimonadota bacterium]
MTEEELKKEILENGNVPRHVAIIMDGNGRWAQARRKPRVFGHRAGMKSVRAVVQGSHQIGCEVLTLYAFSEENWKRPRAEVKALMILLRNYIRKEIKELWEKGIRVNCIGHLEKLDPSSRKALEEAIEHTKDRQRMQLNLAISYGGRTEILDAARTLCREAAEGRLNPDSLDERSFSAALYTAGLPDPDLLIRTSGEMRISNFLLWQIAYTEIYVTPVLWPDFTKKDFFEAVTAFQKRDRRFGRVRST